MRIIYLVLAFGLISSHAAADRVISGVVAVSTGPMQAKHDRGAQAIGRELSAGDNVFLNDEVSTGEQTKAQVMLRDESVFSLAPRSQVVFDSFIYDPNGQENVLEANLVTGGMRFVSGKIADRQPQNVIIKAGTATVGIRGTEIIANHGEEGSTFVLLSGAMEISAPGGLQLIDRPGFGLDVSADGTLGGVRRVPMAEINRILSPPPSNDADADKSADATDDSGGSGENDESRESDEDGNDALASAEDSEAASENDKGENVRDTVSNDTADSSETDEPSGTSSFDKAIIAAVQSGNDEGEAPPVTDLTDISLSLSPRDETTENGDNGDRDEAAEPRRQEEEEVAKQEESATAESRPRERETTTSEFEVALAEPERLIEVDTSLIIDALVEDKKNERGSTIAEEIAENGGSGSVPTLSLETVGTLTTNPFFSSNGTLLIRSQAMFESSDDQFSVTHALLREKFPGSFNDDGIINHADTDDTARQTSGLDFSGYDAAFVYLRRSEGDEFGSSEMETYRDFIHTDGKKVLIIGRSDPTRGHVDPNDPDNPDGMHNMDTALPIYYNGSSGTRYEAGQNTSSSDKILTPTDGSASDLLAGVTAFPYYYSTSNNDLAVDFYPLSGSISADVGILAADGSTAALDLGAKGAVFAGRYACSAYTGNSNSIIRSSLNANLVNNGREQFCRNLISSIAPEDTLVDVEVGTLSVSGNSEGASYRLVGSDSDSFKIIDDKLILNGNASLAAGSYDLTVGVTRAGEEEIERTVSVAVENGVAEKRVISTRDTYNVGDTVSFPTENLVSHKAYLEELTKNSDDVSWISFGSSSGGGTPGNTGIITLHYRITEGDTTYDRFHEIEINHECSSDHCTEFATSMNTVSDFATTAFYFFKPAATVDGVLQANDFSSWSSFFDRFTTGTGRFVSRNYQDATADYHYDLEISYGDQAGILEADGTLGGHTLDERWQFNFLQCSGNIGSHLCPFTDDNDNFDLYVHLANMSLPNGKHSIMLKNSHNWNGGGTSYGWSPMTPQ